MQACELVFGSFNSSGRSSFVNAWITVFGATRITFFITSCTSGAPQEHGGLRYRIASGSPNCLPQHSCISYFHDMRA